MNRLQSRTRLLASIHETLIHAVQQPRAVGYMLNQKFVIRFFCESDTREQPSDAGSENLGILLEMECLLAHGNRVMLVHAFESRPLVLCGCWSRFKEKKRSKLCIADAAGRLPVLFHAFSVKVAAETGSRTTRVLTYDARSRFRCFSIGTTAQKAIEKTVHPDGGVICVSTTQKN